MTIRYKQTSGLLLAVRGIVSHVASVSYRTTTEDIQQISK